MGYFCGVTFDEDNQARMMSTFMMLLFMLTSGGLNNASTYPPVIEQIQYLSPNRYAVEGFFRGMVRDNEMPPGFDRQATLDSLGFTNGDVVVHAVLGGLFFFFVSLGWFVIYIRNRKY